MYKWNKCTMHACIRACLKKEGLEGEDYSYPIYGVISDSNGFYAALTNRRTNRSKILWNMLIYLKK